MSVYAGPADWWTDGTNDGRTHIATKGVVQSGLVLNLDAGVSSSYPGTGTTWTDLSSASNGTLTNGPTYSSANGGSISFDGSNDYCEITSRNTNLEFQPTQAFSAFCWIYNPTYVSATAIFANMQASPTYPGWDMWFNSNSEIAMHLISSWDTNAIKIGISFNYAAHVNKWVNIGYTYNGSCPSNPTDSLNSVNFYINSSLSSTGKQNLTADGFNSTNETITYNPNQRFRVASRWDSSLALMTISSLQVYNRALSAAEISQNFNALRGRFGI